MRCLTCHGRGWIDNKSDNRAQLPIIPCPRCQGTGLDHYCDGADVSSEIDEGERPRSAIELAQEPILRW
jgi:DnaJ-class molecular chaperone